MTDKTTMMQREKRQGGSKGRDFVDNDKAYAIAREYRSLVNKTLKGYTLTDEEIKRKKQLREAVILTYTTMAKKLVKHSDFSGYSLHDKEDMVGEAVVRALSIGLEGHSKYGIEYLIRFNFAEKNNIFAFWTQVIKIFFYQWLNEHYGNINIKRSNMEQMVYDFEYDCDKNLGLPGVKFNFGDCVDGDD